MKNLLKMVIAIMCVAVLAGCNKKSGNNDVNATTEPTTAIENQVTEVVCNEPAIELALHDYDGMLALIKRSQNGELQEGQEVIIDGYIYTFMNELAISQRAADGDDYIGFTLVADGFVFNEEEWDEKVRAKVKAKIVKNKEYFFDYLVADVADVQVMIEPKAE